jgi:BirA family biotin operon repressor/biotin-[acetyl-CoA-carboxylase] ligase
MCVGIAVVDVLRRMVGLHASLKWPNDVVVGNRKIGGILGEIGSDSRGHPFIVLGLGLNVNQRKEEFPKDIQGKASSLCMETGRGHHRVRLLQRIMETIEYTYTAARLGSPMVLQWKEFCSTLGERVRVHLEGRTVVGRAVDLRSNGALVIEQNDGGCEEVRAGDLTGTVQVGMNADG